MSRMEIQSLTTVVDSSSAGGYTLPAELLDAHAIYRRMRALTAPEPPPLDLDAAAARLLDQVAAGHDADPLAAGRELDDADRDRQAVIRAGQLLAAGIEQAATAATTLADGLTERIITDHLRPALDELHYQARQTAAALTGYGLDPHTLVTAPAKVRAAYGRLPELAARRRVILHARRLVNVVGHRTPRHDRGGLFATFANPLHFHPAWQHPAPVPPIPFPTGEVDTLLWIVSDEVAPAQPWLPTVAEQDAAWWALFGDGITARARNHRDALAIGARIG